MPLHNVCIDGWDQLLQDYISCSQQSHHQGSASEQSWTQIIFSGSPQPPCRSSKSAKSLQNIRTVVAKNLIKIVWAHSLIPFIIQDDGLSPGWTLAVSITAETSFTFIRVKIFFENYIKLISTYKQSGPGGQQAGINNIFIFKKKLLFWEAICLWNNIIIQALAQQKKNSWHK